MQAGLRSVHRRPVQNTAPPIPLDSCAFQNGSWTAIPKVIDSNSYITLSIKSHIASLAFLLLAASPVIGEPTRTEETIESGDRSKVPIAKRVTYKDGDQLMYQSFQPLDPQLIGSKSAPLREFLYLQGRKILTIHWFPEAPNFEVIPIENYVIRVSQSPKFQVEAVSAVEKKRFTWSQDSVGRLTVFSQETLQTK